jgi:flagellar protein FlaJ
MRLNIRYNLKREYFTVALPFFIAFIFVAASLINAGFINVGNAKTEEKKSGTFSFNNITEGQELTDEQIIALIEAKKTNPQEKTDSEQRKKQSAVDDIILFGVLIAITPFSIDLFLKKRRLRRYEEDYSDFLFEMSEMMRGGIDPVKAVTELSKSNLGSITKPVRIATARMAYGKSFEYSMRKLAESTGSLLIDRYTDLLIHASYTGGNVSDQIQKSADDMKRFINLEREKEGGLSMYVIIMYMTQGLLLMLSGVFIFSVLPSLQNVNLGMFIKGSSGAALSKTATMQYIYHIVMINAFFVGLISGKVSTGSIKHGLKHSIILLLGSYLVTAYVINPNLGGIEEVKITALKYPTGNVMGGLPLQDPIVFKVTDKKDKPVANASMAFALSGQPGGKLQKAGLKTDVEGLISVYFTPGIQDGTYVVEASYNENKGTAEIKVKNDEASG